MRAHTLFALGAAVLTLPANAVPVEMTMSVLPSMTMVVNGLPEVSNPPMPTVRHKNQDARLIKSKASRPHVLGIRRGVSFRQADYGVKPNVTFDDALRPVAGVEASPSAAAAPAAHSRRWKSYAEYGSNDLDTDDDTPNDLTKVNAAPDPDSAVSDSSAVAQDVSDTNAGSDGSISTTSAGSGADPLKLGNPSSVSEGKIPVQPDASFLSKLLGSTIKALGTSRYSGSYATHDTLGKVTGSGPSSTATTPSAPNVEKADTNVEKTNGLHRRVLAPASYLSTSSPVRRMRQFARGVVQFIARHQLELNTASIVPARPGNTSDPQVAFEQARERNIGLVNIDSNQAPKPRPQIHAMPVNTTQLNTTQVDTTTRNVTKAA